MYNTCRGIFILFVTYFYPLNPIFQMLNKLWSYLLFSNNSIYFTTKMWIIRKKYVASEFIMRFQIVWQFLANIFLRIYSDSFRYLYPSQCESFRTNPKNVLYLVWWKTVKNRSDLIRFNLRQQSGWIRINPKPSFQSELGFLRIDSDWKFDLDQSELGFIRIENLVSNWFGFIRIVASD